MPSPSPEIIQLLSVFSIAFTGPTFSGGVFGDGVGGAVRKEDTDILEMWNKAIAEMSADGTTAEITKKWFGRYFYVNLTFYKY